LTKKRNKEKSSKKADIRFPGSRSEKKPLIYLRTSRFGFRTFDRCAVIGAVGRIDDDGGGVRIIRIRAIVRILIKHNDYSRHIVATRSVSDRIRRQANVAKLNIKVILGNK
jgi:hypothetical protein